MKLISLALVGLLFVGCCATPFPTTQAQCVTPVQLQQAPHPCPIEMDVIDQEDPEAMYVRLMILWRIVEKLEARVDGMQGIHVTR